VGDTIRAPTEGPRPKGTARCRPIFPFGIGTKAANRLDIHQFSLLLISRHQVLYFTVNQYRSGSPWDPPWRLAMLGRLAPDIALALRPNISIVVRQQTFGALHLRSSVDYTMEGYNASILDSRFFRRICGWN